MRPSFSFVSISPFSFQPLRPHGGFRESSPIMQRRQRYSCNPSIFFHSPSPYLRTYVHIGIQSIILPLHLGGVCGGREGMGGPYPQITRSSKFPGHHSSQSHSPNLSSAFTPEKAEIFKTTHTTTL
jgi:hypothetical protein